MTAIPEDVLNATIEICTDDPLLVSAAATAPSDRLTALGWRPMAETDRALFVDFVSLTEAAIGLHGEGTTEVGDEAIAFFEDTSSFAENTFQSEFRNGRVYFHGTDSMLKIVASDRECQIVTGPGPAAERLFTSIPQGSWKTASFPILEYRMKPEARQTGGIHEAAYIYGDNAAQILEREVPPAFRFLVAARAPNSTPRAI
ncbi:hypothetical protein [Pseudogemmobacter sonorensis]|uniref:hypothetical protein n=1 Tax=Pseudogemmobacter sonorensis TaxID=2989681 RepID=UPI0036771728